MRNLTQVEQTFAQLKKLQSQRLRISFDTDEKSERLLQNNIFDKSREITRLLKESEKELRRLGNQESESNSDDQIKTNISRFLAERLRELTLEFKNNEKEHYIKVKEFNGDDE